MDAENVGQVLDVLAARFGTTGAYLWEVLIRQVYVDFAITSAVCLIFTVLCYSSYRWQKGKDWSEPTPPTLALCGSVIALIFSLIFWLDRVRYVLNAEYGALRTVIDAF